MKILLVVAHPRPSSLTHGVAAAFAAEARIIGHTVVLADLYAEGFDPVLREDDEPDWNDPNKVYSPAVRREMARIDANDATVLVFPAWWWSMPAMMKGWIDRVWNQGFAHAGASSPHRRVWMIAIAGNDGAAYTKRGYDAAMRTTLDVGIVGYCSVEDRRLELLYGAIEDAARQTNVRRNKLSAAGSSERRRTGGRLML
ncbi:MAG: NAD(P)H oxidoreductase [Hyphomicrobium sp.]|nr:NAD(P)H oxidoreductase [Hyphomicrobium sp.]